MPTVTFRYYRFNVTRTRGTTPDVQISELELLNNRNRVSYVGATASCPGGTSPLDEEPRYAIDNDVYTKWYTFNISPIIIDFGTNRTTSQYRFATANDFYERDPVTWTFEGSNDNINWTLLDSRENYPTPELRYCYTSMLNYEDYKENPTLGPFSVPSKTFGNPPFTITPPTSNSPGTFSYTSSNPLVATISGSTINIVGAGSSVITANQAATTDYPSASTTATFTVVSREIFVTVLASSSSF